MNAAGPIMEKFLPIPLIAAAERITNHNKPFGNFEDSNVVPAETRNPHGCYEWNVNSIEVEGNAVIAASALGTI